MTTTTEYRIAGMTCAHCERAVAAELTKLPGVADVQVSAAEGAARVASERALDRAAVAAAIEEAGYELEDA